MLTKKRTAKAKAAAIHPMTVNRLLFITFLAVAAYMVLCAGAYAQTTPMGDVLCTVVDFIIVGNLGRGLATLAIIILGVGALLGKASWGLTLTVGVGIAVVFGAPDIVDLLVIAPLC